jgi:hypothetical protein
VSIRRGLAVAAAALAVAVAAGCGFGSGGTSDGEATLTVTRDYGNQRLAEAAVKDPSESETVLRFLDREADIETRYGGGFVQSIEGISGAVEGGRNLDWFFYVNGIESSVGAAEVEVHPGDRIWWDHRDWTGAMRVPAVVGSWPEPFINGAGGEPVEVDCRTADATCGEVEARLSDAGVELGEGAGPRVLVGPWSELRADGFAQRIEDGPATSGVFADFEPLGAGVFSLATLDANGTAVAELGAGNGLIAALRDADEAPTWLITGTDEEGVIEAARALTEPILRDRYAVAVEPGGTSVPLPARGEPH